MTFTAVILAAGSGKRMASSKPQALHEVCGRPQIGFVLSAARQAGAERVIVVTGPDGGQIAAACPGAEFVTQPEPNGTAGALFAALPLIARDSGKVMVLFGNLPLITANTLKMLAAAAQSGVAELVPAGYDAAAQRPARGAFCLDASRLCEAAFTGCSELCQVMDKAAGAALCVAVEAPRHECMSVCDMVRLCEASGIMRGFINAGHMKNGVTLIDPHSTYIDAGVTVGADSVIHPGTELLGDTHIGGACTIFQSRLTDTRVGERCVLQNVVANRAAVGSDVTIGPFVNLRPDTVIADGCKVGDFVEVKNSNIGKKTKLPHLSYIGDADVGERVNVGCGCVFVNYDGFKKHRTVVGDDVFLGCQTNLVAPVTVGNDVYTAAGSTITENIPDGALAIARARQQNKPGWVERIRALKRGQQ